MMASLGNFETLGEIRRRTISGTHEMTKSKMAPNPRFLSTHTFHMVKLDIFVLLYRIVSCITTTESRCALPSGNPTMTSVGGKKIAQTVTTVKEDLWDIRHDKICTQIIFVSLCPHLCY